MMREYDAHHTPALLQMKSAILLVYKVKQIVNDICQILFITSALYIPLS